MQNYLISITGPTAIGKTSTSIELAKAFETEILSADSRQFYKEMYIGTAVPSPEELQAVPHHFIQHISVDQAYDVGDFEQDALARLAQLFKKHQLLFLVGGSGLYVDAVSKGLDKFPKTKPGLREELNKRLEVEGLENLQNQLRKLDPVYASQAAIDNPRRVIRALEVCLSSGQAYTTFLNQPKEPRNFKTIKIGLEAPREIIYERINHRVDIMMKNGLLVEAKKLYPYRHKNALNTIGYRELYKYFDGQCSLEFAVSEIKKNTRRFAKRQLTWFRKDNSIKWFPYDGPTADMVTYLRRKTAKD